VNDFNEAIRRASERALEPPDELEVSCGFCNARDACSAIYSNLMDLGYPHDVAFLAAEEAVPAVVGVIGVRKCRKH
jgi:hypothetical protein